MGFDEDTWQLALDKWNEISKEIGFENRKIAFLQGFYIGHRQAAKTTVSKEEFVKMFKDLCRDAYAAKSAGDMWEADRYRFWYEKLITKDK